MKNCVIGERDVGWLSKVGFLEGYKYCLYYDHNFSTINCIFFFSTLQQKVMTSILYVNWYREIQMALIINIIVYAQRYTDHLSSRITLYIQFNRIFLIVWKLKFHSEQEEGSGNLITNGWRFAMPDTLILGKEKWTFFCIFPQHIYPMRYSSICGILLTKNWT